MNERKERYVYNFMCFSGQQIHMVSIDVAAMINSIYDCEYIRRYIENRFGLKNVIIMYCGYKIKK